MSKKLLIILGGAVLITIILLVFVFFWQKKSVTNTNNANTNTKVPNVNIVFANNNQNQNTNASLTNSSQTERDAVQQTARSFASIYGSFSNQNDYENITSLYFYMTPALKAQQENYVATERAKNLDNSLYHGITSEPRIVSLVDFDTSTKSATVKVTLQRVETSGTNSASTNYNQDITLSLEKIDGVWKVGKIVWGAK